MTGQLLFFSPIIILIAGLFAKDFKIIDKKLKPSVINESPTFSMLAEKKGYSALLIMVYSLILYLPLILIVVSITFNYIFEPSFHSFLLKVISTLVETILIRFFLSLFLISTLIAFLIINILYDNKNVRSIINHT